MASVTEKPHSESSPAAKPPAEWLVDEQIRRTRRALKTVDAAAGVITMAIGVLVFLLSFAVLEHWVVPGGWSPAVRVSLFTLLLLGIAWYSFRIFWPLVRQPINPAYAAQAIEQSTPSLKNSLLNLLLLRGRRQQLSQQVYQAIEQQAAQRLAHVSVESVVDRSAILRLGYVLAVVVALCTLYQLLSPKDPFVSAARVLLPWSELVAPSRVQILDVLPGHVSLARGEQLQVSAEILGLNEDEPVELRYSTADEQQIDQNIRMTNSNGTRFDCKAPSRIALGDSGGVQQDLTYWIEAGDARSPRYQVTVFARPTLVVGKVRYEHPAYTGYPAREVEHTGDIRGIEGTKVTLTAQANKPIHQAHIDFEADGKRDLLMKADQLEATITFPLQLKDDRRTPRYQSYVLRYVTEAGRKNLLPPKYQIDVIPDYAPEIALLLPEEALLDVKLDERVSFELEARDPDFAVRDVTLFGEVAGRQVLAEKLLSEDHQGRFVGKLRKTPAEMGLKVGDVMEYWAAAADNRRPTANVAHTVHRKLRVVGPGENQGDEQQPGDGNQEDREADRNAENQASESGENSDQSEGGAQQQQDAGEEQSEAGQENTADGQPSNKNDSPQDTEQESKANNSPNDLGESGEPSDDPTQGENRGDSQNESRGNDEKVSPEGDDDATAFERITEHFNEKDNAGEGGKAEDTDALPPEDDQGKQQPEDSSPEGKMSAEQGEAGAGDNPGENQGVPEMQDGKKPRHKQDDRNQGARQNDQEPSAESKGQTESDSEGGQGGDRSGGGQEGAGQQADADGKGGPGQHQDAEEGGGRSAQPGEGDAGARPGDQQEAVDKTGKSSEDQVGEGSETTDRQGDKPGGKESGGSQESQESQNADAGQASQASNASGSQGTDQQSADQHGPASQEPSGGGKSGNLSEPPPVGETLPGDEANLKYARNQTDLVLERLDDQLKKQQVDKDLLEKLGWSQEELRRFVERWKHLKSQAASDSASQDAQKKFDDALRSLGLAPNRRYGFRPQTAKDRLRDLQDAYRGRTPLEYQEQVRAYVKGTATAEEQ
ncbi:MAG: hypothetical protein MI725_03395 [Pirellulales bacterium]|nr:hypothetical protein [Pirellulales bacterium]